MRIPALDPETTATLRLQQTGSFKGLKPEGLAERLAAATQAGGLTALPANFGDPDGDWVTVRSENPFEVLYLDYHSVDQITPEIVGRHANLLKKFWEGKLRSLSQGAARIAITKKYGGEHESDRLVRSYPDLIECAFQRMSSSSGIEDAYREIVTELRAVVFARIDERFGDFVIDGVLQPEEALSLLQVGEREGAPREVVAAHIHDLLRRAGMIGKGASAGSTLSQQLIQTVWKHPSRISSEPPPLSLPIEGPARRTMVPLLLFSLAVVVVLLIAAALWASRMPDDAQERVTAVRAVAEPPPAPAPPPAETTSFPATLPASQPEAVAEPAPASSPQLNPAPPPPAVPQQQRDAVGKELEAIGQLVADDPEAALARAVQLDSVLLEHPQEYADERVKLATLRGQIQSAALQRQLAEDSEEARLRAEEEEIRKASARWEQQLAQIEVFIKQANYSGAKQLADTLLKEPNIPEAVAVRARKLADEAVKQLQAIFAGAKVKSKTTRPSDPP